MGAFIEVAKLTSKGQVTIPKTVRQTLGLDDGGRIAFEVSGSTVKLTRVESADTDQADPAIAAFLEILVRDIREGRAIASPDTELLARMVTASQIQADPDEPIEGQVAL